MRCICPPTGLGNPDCPTHGLLPGQAFPPMDRHARDGEDAAMVQRRLYRESLGLPPQFVCVLCGRTGTRAFVRCEGRRYGFRCKSWRSCEKRGRVERDAVLHPAYRT